ncbi:MAG: hypothetical protein IT244_07265 [Bacteroidia bacterium]|nr:hypothetical protein [Bacteroidia bacterium]
MTKLAETIKQLVNAEAAEHNAFIVGQNYAEKGLYQYYVDSSEALTMNILAEITRGVSKKIDELELSDEAFTFEVSSPGADTPLADIRQFGKHIGRSFEIALADKKIEGKLTEIKDQLVCIEEIRTEKIEGKKKTITENFEIPFDTIKSATIKISFK